MLPVSAERKQDTHQLLKIFPCGFFISFEMSHVATRGGGSGSDNPKELHQTDHDKAHVRRC